MVKDLDVMSDAVATGRDGPPVGTRRGESLWKQARRGFWPSDCGHYPPCEIRIVRSQVIDKILWVDSFTDPSIQDFGGRSYDSL